MSSVSSSPCISDERSSKRVSTEPNRTTSPCLSAANPCTASPLTNVPPVDLRSSSNTAPPALLTFAWARLMWASASTRSLV